MKRTLSEMTDGLLFEGTVSEDRTVGGVLLCGLTSKNGYGYRLEAFGTAEEAAALYVNRPVFLNHTKDKAAPANRDLRDLVGVIVSGQITESGPRGSIRFANTDAGNLAMELFRSGPFHDVGMSHVAKVEMDSKSKSVTKIHQIMSVDLVAFPATTNSFFEQQGNQAMDETQVKALIEAAVNPLKTQIDGLKTALVASEQARLSMAATLSTIEEARQQEQRRSAVRAELATAGVTNCAETFVDLLASIDDAAKRAVHIQERVTALKGRDTTGVRSQGQAGVTTILKPAIVPMDKSRFDMLAAYGS